MPKARRIVYLDTCAIIEAHRMRCWKALVARHELHTVKECWDELGRGNPRDSEYIPVDLVAMQSSVEVHVPSPSQRASAILRSERVAVLDAGEKDLLAWLAAQNSEVMLLTTGDRAAIMAACELGLANRLITLEELANEAGTRPELRSHFRKAWLAGIRTAFALGDR